MTTGKKPAYNSGLAKMRLTLLCMVEQTIVHPMNISANKPLPRYVPKRSGLIMFKIAIISIKKYERNESCSNDLSTGVELMS